jgi:hypothetical protein
MVVGAGSVERAHGIGVASGLACYMYLIPQ